LNGALCKGRQKAFYSHRLSRHNKYVAPFRNGRFFFSCFSFAQGAILIVITCISFRNGRFFFFIYLFFLAQGPILIVITCFLVPHVTVPDDFLFMFFHCSGRDAIRHHMFPPK
jgi:hypothetical protein